jgi:hypothetical protein
MKRRVVVINFCMLMGIILMAMRFISAWESFEEANSLEQIASSAGREALEGSSGVAPMGSPLPFSDFIVISERNLFAEDRRPPAVEEEEVAEVESVVEEPPKWTDRPTLHGVSVMKGERQAIFTSFESGQGVLHNIRIGDWVQGYQVAEIGDSMVRLRWKDRDEIIDMADAHGSVPVEAGKSSTASVTVITVGSAPAAVQTASGKAAGQPEGTGIQVSVVSGQANPAAGAQTGRSQNEEGSASAGRRGAQPRR